MSEPGIPLAFEETDLVGLLDASLAPLFAEATSERIELRVVKLGEIPRVRVDREKLAWCVATLVGNALRYIRKGDDHSAGGSVIVHVVHDEAHPDQVSIAVQDDGPGIPDDKLPFLFERRKGALHAAGLSLELVRDIVAAHGGRIEVESRRGDDEHGTSVSLHLPQMSSR